MKMIKLVVLMAAPQALGGLPCGERVGQVPTARPWERGAAGVCGVGHPPPGQVMRRLEGLTILVVDGRHELAESLSNPLRADGHVVGEVDDGALALAAARKQFPDVVLLNADVPGLDAPAVAEGIGGLWVTRKPLFIALAGEPVRECPPKSPASNIDLYLGKPADTDRLRSLLRRFQSVVKDFESFDPMI